jgi:hypothetical protein
MFTTLILASKNGNILNHNAIIEQVMNGLPRFCFPSGLNIVMFLFLIFPPLIAYLVNDFLVRIIAFIGMYLLLKKHFLKSDVFNEFIALGVSICFALIPYYSLYGITVAGQPLLLFAFLNLLKGDKSWRDFLIILLFPFYSSFIYGGIFICIALFSIFLINSIIRRKINILYLVGLSILSIGYIIVEYSLIISFFFNSDFVSHRNEWHADSNVTFISMVIDAMNLFFKTQYHSGAFYTLLIILSVLLAFIFQRRFNKSILYLSGSIIFIMVFYLIDNYLVLWFSHRIRILITFQWNRFYFLLPALWMMLFAVSMEQIKLKKYSKYLVAFLILVQLILVIINDRPYIKNVLSIAGIKSGKSANYNEFYAENLFTQIGEYIKKDKKTYRVISIGLFPSISQYNGFYTLDSYQNSYPSQYKHSFRRIIEKELSKNKNLKTYFDNWGNRCYIFSSELSGECFECFFGKYFNKELNNLELNAGVLKEMGCNYIFSAAKINNLDENDLKYLKKFSDNSAYWDIYLYEVY